MYDPIFAKSFSRYERKRFGCALFLCLFIALGISSSFKPHLPHRLSVIGDSVNFQLSINAGEDLLVIDDNTSHQNLETIGKLENVVEDLQLSTSADENMLAVNDTSMISQPIAIDSKKVEPIICSKTSNYCEIEGDIRVQPNSSTIFVLKPLETISNSTNSWIIEPYPRKFTSRVKNWTVKLLGHENDNSNIPKCTRNHRNPAILFSIGGFTGNYFHDFADILFPLYSTSFHFQKEVHFLASDYTPWWINKFRQILNKLTKHDIVDIDRENPQVVHCYNKMVLGLKFHKELTSLPKSGPSMQNFRQLLRQTYALDRKTVTKSRKRDHKTTRRACLMIVSRKTTRTLINEEDVSRLATKFGYEVVLGEAGASTNVSRFAQIVNSCDVLMGVHGAGLTNMVFLPDDAVLIQVVPFGAVDVFARLDFGDPAVGMKLRYLEYKVTVKESSLSKQYPSDHPILNDPDSYKRMGWNALYSVYLANQNVTIDLRRFKGTLAKALKLLRH